MIDLDEPMFTLDDDNNHVLTPICQKVVDWSVTLPDGGSQGIPGKRKRSAVCGAWNSKFKTWIEDFDLTKEEFNSVMGGNGPPRYDMFTGYYYDYGGWDNNNPNAELICTDQDLLVVKGSADGTVPPPETEAPPPETGRPPSGGLPDRPDRPDRDGQAKRDERQAERDARQAERQPAQDERKAERDARQDERQTKRDERRND